MQIVRKKNMNMEKWTGKVYVRLLGRLLAIIILIFTTLTAWQITDKICAITSYAENMDEQSKNSSGFRFNMSYIHFSDKSSYLEYVNNTKDSLNEVAPSYFSLDKLGNFQVSYTLDKNFIEEMHNRGIKVVPYLSNDWDRSSGQLALRKRHKLSDAIAEAVEKYNLDGVNVDLENLTEEDRDRYTDFVRLLRKKLSPEKTVAVAVASNPKGITTGWHGSYDYEGLARYSNYLMLMTYDEHYGGSSAGPVASIGFVERSVEYALKYVPKEKIVLGIPFYGRIWRTGGGISGRGISLKEAQSLISRYGGKVSFSNAYLSPKATISIKSVDPKPSIYGGQLQAGTYTIWYENEESIKYKLSLVDKYDLKGTGSWSLGQEPSSVWNYYSLWLNGHYYTDVEGHWARNPIIYSLNKGLITTKEVKEKSGFAPDQPLTRAEAAVALVRALDLEKDRRSGNKISFIDIADHWAKNEIEIAAQYGIITGRSDGTFAPDDPVSREEMSVMLDRLFSINTRGNILASRSSSSASVSNVKVSYKDVNNDVCKWSYDSIIRMSQQGIITGSPEGYFKPKDKITRAEAAALLYRLLEG